MDLMLAGDVHGDLNHWQVLTGACRRFGVNRIFQLGDFGYFDHLGSHRGNMDKISKIAARNDVHIYWLDGNHDNHPLLWDLYQEEDDEGFIVVRDNIRYSPRGHHWTWEGVRFVSVGGAYSIDKEYRHPGVSWWDTEMITENDVQKAVSGGKVDVALFHDAPKHVDLLPYFHVRGTNAFYKQDHNSLLNRERLHDVVVGCEPKYIWHGHMHLRYMDDRFHIGGHPVRVEGLGMNGHGPDSYRVISLDDGKVII